MPTPNPGGSDWIELYNKNATLPAALNGLYIQTNGDAFRVSALAFIAPNDYLQLFCDEKPGVNQLDFKLAAGGAIFSILDPNGVKFDTVSFGPQAQGISQGRVPDGTGAIMSFSSGGTGGAVNYSITYTGPALNEILACNITGAQAPWGTRADWVELYSPSNAPVDLGGMKLSVINAATARTIPPNTIIPSQGYLAIWCDPAHAQSTVAGADLNTGSGLGDASGSLYLFNSIGQLVNSIEWGFQLADQSIRLTAGSWKLLANSTRASANSAPALLDAPGGLKINEWSPFPSMGPDWFKLYNAAPNPVDMGGLYLADDPSEVGRAKFRIPPLSFIASTGWIRWEADNSPELGRKHVNFNLDSGAEYLRLSNPDLSSIDTISFGFQTIGVSQGCFPDGAASVVAMPFSATPGGKNALLSVFPATQSLSA
ncbi:MAG: putative secreted protein [Chthoniobacteraceae bacterium]|nr:putative secreted protein [Chthoniobacteraceae bacterium]